MPADDHTLARPGRARRGEGDGGPGRPAADRPRGGNAKTVPGDAVRPCRREGVRDRSRKLRAVDRRAIDEELELGRTGRTGSGTPSRDRDALARRERRSRQASPIVETVVDRVVELRTARREGRQRGAARAHVAGTAARRRSVCRADGKDQAPYENQADNRLTG